jgi:hypothetical protein
MNHMGGPTQVIKRANHQRQVQGQKPSEKKVYAFA